MCGRAGERVLAPLAANAACAEVQGQVGVSPGMDPSQVVGRRGGDRWLWAGWAGRPTATGVRPPKPAATTPNPRSRTRGRSWSAIGAGVGEPTVVGVGPVGAVLERCRRPSSAAALHGHAGDRMSATQPAWRYSSSVTCSSHVTTWPCSSDCCIATCAMKRSAVAPCRCSSLGSMKMTSPRRVSVVLPPR